eukprot:759325-Hanusia_phi.AAC.4
MRAGGRERRMERERRIHGSPMMRQDMCEESGRGGSVVRTGKAMAWNAGPAMIAINNEGLRGRSGIGGGAAWKRVAGKVDSRMHDRGNVYAQQDLGKLRDEEQAQYVGNGWGMGHAWPEGGEHRKESFHRNAGWTYDGTQEQARSPAAAENEHPAVGARAILQVFRSMQKMPGEIRVHDGERPGMQPLVGLGWRLPPSHHDSGDHLPPPPHAILPLDVAVTQPSGVGVARDGDRVVEARKRALVDSHCGVGLWFLWALTEHFSTGRNYRIPRFGFIRLALRDGDVIGLGKGRTIKVEDRIQEKELVYQVDPVHLRQISCSHPVVISKLIRVSSHHQFVFRNPLEANSSYIPPQTNRRSGSSELPPCGDLMVSQLQLLKTTRGVRSTFPASLPSSSRHGEIVCDADVET